MKAAVFTSTISPQLLVWMDAEAKKTKKTRRHVLEDALIRRQNEMIRAQMRADFAREDPAEMKEWAEWGMKQYSEDLAKYENDF